MERFHINVPAMLTYDEATDTWTVEVWANGIADQFQYVDSSTAMFGDPDTRNERFIALTEKWEQRTEATVITAEIS